MLKINNYPHITLRNAEGAAKCYDEVIQQLAQQPGEKCDQAMYWTEEALYRSSLLNVRLG